jgi:hypothetical protein
MDSQLIEKIIEAVSKELPSLVSRHKINEQSASWPYSKGTMQNRDCDGTGVKERFMVGKHVFYLREKCLEFLRDELSKKGAGNE